MKDWKNLTLGDLLGKLARYQPFIALVAAVLVAMTLLAGDPGDDEQDLTAGTFDREAGEASGTPGFEGVEGTDTTLATDGSGELDAAGNPLGGGTSGATSGRTGTRTQGGGGGTTSNTDTNTNSGPQPVPEGSISPNCDPATGRIKVPTHFAAPCVQVSKATTSDWQGVSADEIVVVSYRGKSNEATAAALRAAGAADPEDASRATIKAYVDYFDQHYEQYGRKIKLIFVPGSGEPDDDAAGRADARTIAKTHKAFVSIGDPNNAFVDELVANKVLCICTTSQPQENYERWNPFAGYTSLMSSTQGYVHRAEYIGKRLAGRKAVHAGTRDGLPMNTEDRKFGLLWFETPDGAYKAGVDFFKVELQRKYGVSLAADQSFTGAIGPGANPAKTQQEARPAIQKMKSAGVNSLAFSGDPLSPSFFTQEATRQNYFPEWIITGSALTDTSLFARTYDQTQWQRAFGISFLTARVPEALGDSYRLHQWQYKRGPAAENTHGVLYAPIHYFFLGVHMAGPKLNPLTFQQGLFRYPVTGGFISFPTVSFGNHGLWDFTDFTAFDDVTEIWWDGNAVGEDETGTQGKGLYRYVEGGKRYLPTKHPTSDPKAFNPAGTTLIYNDYPQGDKPPEYPPPR